MSVCTNLIKTSALPVMAGLGLSIVIVIFVWPLFVSPIPFLFRIPFIIIHISLLIFFDPYLYIHRKICYPLRQIVMPLVVSVAKSESIGEGADTWYVAADNIPITSDAYELLESCPKRVRKEIRRKLRAYEKRNLKVVSKHSDYLSLWKDMPVLIDHERKVVNNSDSVSSFAEEFLKRFLVIFLGTNGFMDRYFAADATKPVALAWFVEQDRVLHAFMYFCEEAENDSGIWFYQHFRMMLRLASHSIQDVTRTTETSIDSPLLQERRLDYLNFQVHQDFAKKCVGGSPCPCDDDDMISSLYPFAFFRDPTTQIVETTLDCQKVLS